MGKIYSAMGLMSGTSLDGVDVSIIETDGNREFSPILDRYYEYDKELIQKILNIREKITDPDKLDKHLDEIEDLERMVDVGVDGIITDYPDRAQSVLSRFGLTW